MKVINTLKKLLFGRASSSLNLFMVMPVLILTSVCCLCSGGKDEPRTCLTSDGENLIWAGFDLLSIRLADGSVTTLEKARSADVMCLENNEVVTFKEKFVNKNREPWTERTAFWRGGAKSYKLADIEYFQKTIGVIKNRYFVTSSRNYVEKSRSVGSGKSRSTEYYKVYNQPQIFSLEDSTGGQLKSHYLYREKLGVPETVLYDELSFYPLKLDENGTLVFAMKQKGELAVNLFKINMFDGNIARTGVSVAPPADMQRVEQVTTDKSGKFIALVYEGKGNDGYTYQKSVNVIDAQTGRTIISKKLNGVAFNSGTPTLVFEENGTRLAIFVDGFRLEPTRDVTNVTIFDLQTGGEIAYLDTEEFFKNPRNLGVIKFIGDDLLVTYIPQNQTARDEVRQLCKLNVLTKQIAWNINLPEK